MPFFVVLWVHPLLPLRLVLLFHLWAHRWLSVTLPGRAIIGPCPLKGGGYGDWELIVGVFERVVTSVIAVGVEVAVGVKVVG